MADPYVYQYVIGGTVFVVGLYFAARQRYIGFSGSGLRHLILLIGGLMFYMALQGYLQYAPMSVRTAVAIEGNYERTKHLGTSLDYGVMVAYFLVILAVGTWFGRRQKTTRDFFFGGQRFSWWLIAMSMVATLVGSYSFVKYSRVAYDHGLCSSQGYLNDWFWMPLFAFGWLPIFYFSRITSIPEYFERRFDRRVRLAATVILLIYLISYVGVNLYTMGQALNSLLGWNVLYAAILVASISAVYVTFGGQTSVIMTDLFQGLMLLATGALILFLGIKYVGGAETFWESLPRSYRRAFSDFNADPSFPAVGIFWQDAMANTAMFYFLNQGIVMRFMAARSVGEARKAVLFVAVIMMPIAACVVSGGGWVARALVQTGLLSDEINSKDAFFIAADIISTPGVFGLIMAAVTAALMSTVDSLITGVSAVAVNDIYRQYVKQDAGEKQALVVARLSAIAVTLLGIALVPVFAQFKTIYAAHGAMTAAVTPPLVVTLLGSVFWRRFTRAAALWTLVGGMAAIVFSIFVPEVIMPFAQGVPMAERGEGLLAGMNQFKFMRALFGLSVSSVIGVTITLFTRPEPLGRARGLVTGTVADAIAYYKGSPGSETSTPAVPAVARRHEVPEKHVGPAGLPVVNISTALAARIDARSGDLLYLSDHRWWLGGLHSAHAVVGEIIQDDQPAVDLAPPTFQLVARTTADHREISVQRLY